MYGNARYNPHSYDSKDELRDIVNVNIVNLFTGIRYNRSLHTPNLMNILVEDVLSRDDFENDLPTFLKVIIAKLIEQKYRSVGTLIISVKGTNITIFVL